MLTQINTNGKSVLLNQPKTLYYNYFNQSTHNVLLNFDVEGGCFVIYEFHKDLKQAKLLQEKRGDFTSGAVFISKDKMCVLDANKDLAVCGFDGSSLKKVPLQNLRKGGQSRKVDALFPGPLGKVLLHVDGDTLVLYDVAARKNLHELQVTEVKNVYWTHNFSHAAIVTKTCKICVLNKVSVDNGEQEHGGDKFSEGEFKDQDRLLR